MRAKRVDKNQAEVIAKFLKAMPDATVHDASAAGEGFTDLVIGWKGVNYMIEIKNPENAPSKRKLNDVQEAFHLKWQGHIAVCHTAEEICAEIARNIQKNQ